MLSDLGSGEAAEGKASKGDSQLLKKMTNRMSDFESQVSTQIQQLTQVGWGVNILVHPKLNHLDNLG